MVSRLHSFFFIGNYIEYNIEYSACILKNVLLDAVELILEPDCK